MSPAVAVPVSPDLGQMRRQVDQLCSISRPSASSGEQQAAGLIRDYFRGIGFQARVETERAHGHYWLPLAMLSAAGAAGGLLGRRRRAVGGAIAGAAAAGVWSDLTGSGLHARKLLKRRDTFNVVAELGPRDATRTVVLVAHHDAAKSGAIFNPAIPEKLTELVPSLADQDSSPPLMFPVFAGPLLASAGAVLGSKLLSSLGAVVCAGAAATFCEIGSRDVVPGANDNISGVVALLALGAQLAAHPTERIRVMLVSTGSEESFMEGMAGFARRHFPRLPVQDTVIICVDTVGSDRLLSLAGEGMLKLYRYPQAGQALLADAADETGVELITDVVLRNATDGLYAAKAGYTSAMLGSVSAHNAPANYHWPTDTPDNVNYETLADAVRLLEATVRRLDHRWV